MSTTSFPFVLSTMTDDEINETRRENGMGPITAEDRRDLEEFRERARREVLTDDDRAEIAAAVARLPGGWRVDFCLPNDDPVLIENTHGGCANIVRADAPLWSEPPFSVSKRVEEVVDFLVVGANPGWGHATLAEALNSLRGAVEKQRVRAMCEQLWPAG